MVAGARWKGRSGTVLIIRDDSQAGTGEKMLSCQIVSDFADAPSADEWDALVERAGGDVFSTYDWCRSWWEFYGGGRRLEIHVFTDGGRLAGILPCFGERLMIGGIPLRVIRLLGCDHTVTTANVILGPGAEDEVIGAFAFALRERGDWDVVSFGPLPGYFSGAGEIARALAANLPSADVYLDESAACHIVFDLPDTFEAYLAGISANERGYIRKTTRRLERDHEMKRIIADSGDSLVEAFDRFVAMHQRQWRSAGRLGHFGDWPRAKEFHRALVGALSPKGRAAILETTADGKTISTYYLLRFGDRCHAILDARDASECPANISLGRVGFGWLAEYVISCGAPTLDTLRGYYGYKIRAGGMALSQKSITVVRHTLKARAGLKSLRLAARAIHLAYYRLWFSRIGPRLGLLRGPLWRAWIRSKV